MREGRCQPLGTWLCQNGGEDICRYHGNGTRIGDPLCDCKPGFWGRWCETDASSHSYIRLEGVEPRHSVSVTKEETRVEAEVSEEIKTSTKTSQAEVRETTRTLETSQKPEQINKLDEEDFHELIHEEFGIRAIHSDIFNSGKLVESLGSREGLH